MLIAGIAIAKPVSIIVEVRRTIQTVAQVSGVCTIQGLPNRKLFDDADCGIRLPSTC